MLTTCASLRGGLASCSGSDVGPVQGGLCLLTKVIPLTRSSQLSVFPFDTLFFRVACFQNSVIDVWTDCSHPALTTCVSLRGGLASCSGSDVGLGWGGLCLLTKVIPLTSPTSFCSFCFHSIHVGGLCGRFLGPAARLCLMVV
jgi:hypothetical protein